MKILIVGFHPRGHVPYVGNYENALNKLGIDYDAVYWDRFNDGDLEKNNNEFIIHIRCSLGGNRLKKIIPMFKYRSIVKNIIKDGCYDKIIVLSTLPAVLLSGILLSRYRNKYILDIRDYTYEKYNFYKNIVDDLVDKSFFTGISSKGFMRFLHCNNKIVYTHNITNESAEIKDVKVLDLSRRINIGFVGGVRYFRENSALISKLDSSKFCLSYIGYRHSDCDLEEFCIKRGIRNVFFKGKFKNEDKPQIYRDIDIINSLYGDFSLEVTTAVPNRLYDALLFKKPIIVSKGTYLAEIVINKGIGIAVDINNDDVNDLIVNYVKSINYNDFVKNANVFLNEIRQEQNCYLRKIDEFLKA